MRIAVTGGTGFIGRYILHQLVGVGHQLQVWHRKTSDRSGLERIADKISWQLGKLGVPQDADALVAGCDAVVHGAFDRPGRGFRATEGDLIEFCQTNIIGSLQLIQASRAAGVKRFIFISSCAVHDKILDDRPLDETHPTWAASHYGAYKAAVEQFVYSFGLGHEYPICAVRPTGIYGVNHPLHQSKWFDLVRRVVRGESVTCDSGGKEVHAADVAKTISLLLESEASRIRGEVFNCYDRYISQYEVASLAKRLSGSGAQIHGQATSPKNQIETGKIRSLGMRFGGEPLLESTIEALVNSGKSG
jgi:nucleoside-diphosphate-sugar epimerase